MCWLPGNLGVWASWNPQGLSRPVMGLLYLLPIMDDWFAACVSWLVIVTDILLPFKFTVGHHREWGTGGPVRGFTGCLVGGVCMCVRARANSGLCVAAACRLWWGGGRLTPEPSVCAGTEAAVPPARSPTGNLFPVLTSSCLLTFFFHLCYVTFVSY